MPRNTLRKSERLDKKKIIEKMFAGGSRSFSMYPLRVVYLPVEGQEAEVSILVSVSKRRFKRAVKRNRVKRQIREAYRLNKQPLIETLRQRQGPRLAVAFIYLSDELVSTALIAERMKTALARIAEQAVPTASISSAAASSAAVSSSSASVSSTAVASSAATSSTTTSAS